MIVQNHAPYVRRGVTQLMYVGDDQAVETATKPPVDLVRIAKIAGVAWVAMWILSGISPPAPNASRRR